MQKSTHLPAPAPGLDGRAALVLVGCCLIWGVGLVMVKYSVAGISPVANAGLRSIAAGLILWAWAALRGVPIYGRDGTLWAGLLCGGCFSVEFVLLYMGIARTAASRATIFLHCAPFVAAYGEHLLVPGHRLTRIKVLGLLAAFVGLAVAMGEGLFQGLSGDTLVGDLLCLGGGAFWGLTTVVVKASRLRSAPAEKTMLYQLGVSSLLLPLAAYGLGEVGVRALTPQVVGAFAYTVLLVVVVGYTTWFWLMRSYSAASLHAFTFLTPIFGVIAGAVLLGEALSRGVLAGLVLVAVGIWLVNRPVAAG